MKENWLLNGDEKSKIRAMLLSQFKCRTAYGPAPTKPLAESELVLIES
jgi:hypothetical protein